MGLTIITAIVQGEGHGAVFITALVFLALIQAGLLLLLRLTVRRARQGGRDEPSG